MGAPLLGKAPVMGRIRYHLKSKHMGLPSKRGSQQMAYFGGGQFSWVFVVIDSNGLILEGGLLSSLNKEFDQFASGIGLFGLNSDHFVKKVTVLIIFFQPLMSRFTWDFQSDKNLKKKCNQYVFFLFVY